MMPTSRSRVSRPPSRSVLHTVPGPGGGAPAQPWSGSLAHLAWDSQNWGPFSTMDGLETGTGDWQTGATDWSSAIGCGPATASSRSAIALPLVLLLVLCWANLPPASHSPAAVYACPVPVAAHLASPRTHTRTRTRPSPVDASALILVCRRFSSFPFPPLLIYQIPRILCLLHTLPPSLLSSSHLSTSSISIHHLHPFSPYTCFIVLLQVVVYFILPRPRPPTSRSALPPSHPASAIH
jgi:hypothetical protein